MLRKKQSWAPQVSNLSLKLSPLGREAPACSKAERFTLSPQGRWGSRSQTAPVGSAKVPLELSGI